MKYIKLFEANSKQEEFIEACITGDLDTVKKLMNKVDLSGRYNLAMQMATENGHLEIVKTLLEDPRVDPTASNNYAIRYATEYGYDNIVILLLQDKRVRDKLTDEEIAEYGKVLTTDLILNLNK